MPNGRNREDDKIERIKCVLHVSTRNTNGPHTAQRSRAILVTKKSVRETAFFTSTLTKKYVRIKKRKNPFESEQ